MVEELTAQITFDLVMEEDMPFVEGCYKLFNKNWEIFIISLVKDIPEMVVEKEVVWESGNIGTTVKLPGDAKLNKNKVLKVLSNILDVTTWSEVLGPDSMQLR